jgi:hypothetical protein
MILCRGVLSGALLETERLARTSIERDEPLS